MTVEQVRDAVVAWFGGVGLAGLILPTGWFGRPYDNRLELTESMVAAARLVLVLDDQHLLVLTRPTEVEAEGGTLRISGFVHGLWDWNEYASSRSSVETFGEGTVEFIA